ncbi:uncharacterized protein LOC116288137 [Actinia tenebrosa]|uniref:Uncharacterized protein LOC116288137 n=1 Tax=Actinia tenebrosa TaxID=6105 RepID=A0A6P8H5J9_ACTTE|nr:uncharacterized protein LOC116288137 [Actinia tenebrosa]
MIKSVINRLKIYQSTSLTMPGDNCSVVGCGTCRNSKGISIWKLPAPRNDEYEKWRLDWLNELTKYREVDKHFQKLIDNDRVYTCEKHFGPEHIEHFQSEKMTKKKPKFGALPTLNMPRKSVNTTKTVPRQPRSIVKDHEEDSKKRNVYNHFSELCKRVQSLKTLAKWKLNVLEDRLD